MSQLPLPTKEELVAMLPTLRNRDIVKMQLDVDQLISRSKAFNQQAFVAELEEYKTMLEDLAVIKFRSGKITRHSTLVIFIVIGFILGVIYHYAF